MLHILLNDYLQGYPVWSEGATFQAKTQQAADLAFTIIKLVTGVFAEPTGATIRQSLPGQPRALRAVATLLFRAFNPVNTRLFHALVTLDHVREQPAMLSRLISSVIVCS